MILHFDYHSADRIQQCHLSFGEFHLLNKSHEVLQYGWCIWHKPSRGKFEWVKDISELAASGNSYHKIVDRVLFAEQKSEDLVNGIPVQLIRLYWNPLTD